MSVLPMEELVQQVQAAVRRLPTNGYTLQVVKDGVRHENEWWYVPVTPSKPGVRAHEYAELLTRAENQLQAELSVKVLLIPTFVD